MPATNATTASAITRPTRARRVAAAGAALAVAGALLATGGPPADLALRAHGRGGEAKPPATFAMPRTRG